MTMNTKQQPIVTPIDIDASIASEHYFTAADGRFAVEGQSDTPLPEDPLALLTFCVLVTKNGHTVTGESHCQDPAKFDAEIGKQEARKVAIQKLWPMVVYAAREKAPEPVKAKEYELHDIKAYKYQNHSGIEKYSARMTDGQEFSGSVNPSQVPAGLSTELSYRRAFLADINRQAREAAQQGGKDSNKVATAILKSNGWSGDGTQK